MAVSNSIHELILEMYRFIFVSVRIVSDAPEVVAMGCGRFGASLSTAVHVRRRPDGRRQTETRERVGWGSRARERLLNL